MGYSPLGRSQSQTRLSDLTFTFTFLLTLVEMTFKNTDCFADYRSAAKSLRLCPTLCDPTDSSPPGSPVPGILQARILEWVAISFSVLEGNLIKLQNT